MTVLKCSLSTALSSTLTLHCDSAAGNVVPQQKLILEQLISYLTNQTTYAIAIEHGCAAHNRQFRYPEWVRVHLVQQ